MKDFVEAGSGGYQNWPDRSINSAATQSVGCHARSWHSRFQEKYKRANKKERCSRQQWDADIRLWDADLVEMQYKDPPDLNQQ